MDSGDLLQSTVMVSGSTGVSAAAWAEASLAESFTSLAAEIFFSVFVVFFFQILAGFVLEDGRKSQNLNFSAPENVKTWIFCILTFFSGAILEEKRHPAF